MLDWLPYERKPNTVRDGESGGRSFIRMDLTCTMTKGFMIFNEAFGVNADTSNHNRGPGPERELTLMDWLQGAPFKYAGSATDAT